MDDMTLTCVTCGTDFAFTPEEQEFFSSKGFDPPKRCKPCRVQAKAEKRGGGGSRFGGGGGGGGGRGFDRGPRQMFDTVCAGCGCDTQVPFKPDGRKPVYCKDCFQASRSY